LPTPKSKKPHLKEKENQKGSQNFATICPPQQACDALFNQIQPYNDYLSIYSFIFSSNIKKKSKQSKNNHVQSQWQQDRLKKCMTQ